MKDSITGKTKLLGIIGDPIEHSFSPLIHNKFCSSLDIDFVYIPFRVEPQHLEQAVKGMKALEIKGWNVTIPHKQTILQYLDEVSEEALLMGAVNTVKNENGKLYGYNTDGAGFVKSLQSRNVLVKGKTIIILGAGGAARGIAISLALEGAKRLIILNRTQEKAEEIANIINTNISYLSESDILSDDILMAYLDQCDILINTTPLGMAPDSQKCCVESMNTLKSSTVVCDLIYNPTKTKFLQKAEQAGCMVINGWGMLLYQAVLSFQIWTGKKVNNEVLNTICKECDKRNELI